MSDQDDGLVVTSGSPEVGQVAHRTPRNAGVSDTVLLWYDDFHTPLSLLRSALGDALVLVVDIGGDASGPDLDSGWRVHRVNERDRFCHTYLLRAILANAVYQGGYLLSAALSRPLLAETTIATARAVSATRVVHGFAGNDQVRFEMAMHALAPELVVVPVAALLGSQNTRNHEGYTVSENLWGRSIEAGPLADPAVRPPAEVFRRCGSPDMPTPPATEHRLSFLAGRPVAVDGEPLRLPALLERVEALAASFGVGFSDCVEDGYVGLKTRVVYEAPGATALVAAHRDIERLVSSRRQNDVTALVDQAWTNLVYDGGWFDPLRVSLEAYIDDVNRWATGEVTLLFRAGTVQPVARGSAYALYDEKAAVYRVGQDIAVGTSGPAAALSAPMTAAVRRGDTCAEPEVVSSWNA
jgi:argininosuccinate synthase